MRPTFLGVETALRGIQSNQKALDIVGQNLTNMATPGYTRQRSDQVSMTLSGYGRYDVTNQKYLAGQGTEIVGVGQVRDPFLDKLFREEYASVAYYDQSASILSDIESALDELGETGIQQSFEDILSALKSFSSNPDDETHASIVMNEMVQLTQVINQFDIELSDISDQQKFDAEIAVDEVNAILERIAHLNTAIKETMQMNSAIGDDIYGPNELLDERNMLLDELAYYGDIQVTEKEHGVVEVTMGNQLVIDDDKAETLNYVITYDDQLTLSWQSDGAEFTSEGGSLLAYLHMVNGAGGNPTSEFHNFEDGIPYYRDQLDALAMNIANVFNNTIPLEDTTNGPYKVLFEPSDIANITAANLTVAQDWLDDPSYVMEGVNKNGELDNTYILSMIENFDTELNFGEYTGTLNGFVSFINTTIGQQVTYNTSRLTATSAVTNDVLNRRDSVSAVSMDEEGADLMMYNAAYQAVARVMTTLDEALNTIINGMGLVGR